MWSSLWEEHRASLLGLAGGLLLGFIFLFTGFWNMLVFAFIVFVSFLVGRYYKELEVIVQELVQRILQRIRS